MVDNVIIRAAHWSCRPSNGGTAELHQPPNYDVSPPEGCTQLHAVRAFIRSPERWLTRVIAESTYVRLFENGTQFLVSTLSYLLPGGQAESSPLSIHSKIFVRKIGGRTSPELAVSLEFHDGHSKSMMPLLERLNWLMMEAELRGDEDWGVDIDVHLHFTGEERHAD